MSIDAMKQALEALEEINKLSIGENAICLPAEIDGAITALRAAIEQAQPKQEPNLQEQLDDALQSLAFYRRRIEALQKWQSKMRDPERTIVCDIIANGSTLEPAGDRYKHLAQQQAQEPVAWMYHDIRHDNTPHERPSLIWKPEYMDAMSFEKGAKATPLYTAPHQWQGLTEQEIKDCEKQAMVNGSLPFEQRSFFARAIEAKLREKNHD